jgi:RimJ/RimL family protein N-acetyltransferase
MTEVLFETLAAPMSADGLSLRALRADDEDALAPAFEEDELWTWMLVHPPQQRADVRAWIETARERVRAREHVAFVLELADGTLAGTTRFLEVREYDRCLEIGWTMLFARARGTWINGRAKTLLIGRAFDAGMQRVQLKTDARNVRSRAAIAAIGATFEGTLRAYQRRADGTNRDTAMFSIVASEWPAIARALDARTAMRKESA